MLLRAARGECQRGVAGVQVREMRDLVGQHGAADAGVVGPAVHAGLVEGAVEDELAAALKEIEQRELALWALEDVRLLDGDPRQAAIHMEVATQKGHMGSLSLGS